MERSRSRADYHVSFIPLSSTQQSFNVPYQLRFWVDQEEILPPTTSGRERHSVRHDREA
jgi:hypothetical protein